MIPRVETKSSKFISIFHEQSGWNLAGAKFFVLWLIHFEKYKLLALKN
jgi:hypothetical protein